ncbi:MAG: hypothetical protein H0U96_01575 [Acidobacteria bacterium]|jgi:hypothetical protein|nr:hypothetical protein [Acidobacteriota bacterium]
MQSNIQEVYQEQILPLDEKERLKLAALIINDISNKPETNGQSKTTGGIREMFGTWSSGNPQSSDNEQIDADLARAYADTHDDE